MERAEVEALVDAKLAGLSTELGGFISDFKSAVKNDMEALMQQAKQGAFATDFGLIGQNVENYDPSDIARMRQDRKSDFSDNMKEVDAVGEWYDTRRRDQAQFWQSYRQEQAQFWHTRRVAEASEVVKLKILANMVGSADELDAIIRKKLDMPASAEDIGEGKLIEEIVNAVEDAQE